MLPSVHLWGHATISTVYVHQLPILQLLTGNYGYWSLQLLVTTAPGHYSHPTTAALTTATGHYNYPCYSVLATLTTAEDVRCLLSYSCI
jgi:hypothetical protein